MISPWATCDVPVWRLLEITGEWVIPKGRSGPWASGPQNTVDGCEILHQLIGGFSHSNPIWLVVDLALWKMMQFVRLDHHTNQPWFTVFHRCLRVPLPGAGFRNHPQYDKNIMWLSENGELAWITPPVLAISTGKIWEKHPKKWMEIVLSGFYGHWNREDHEDVWMWVFSLKIKLRNGCGFLKIDHRFHGSFRFVNGHL